MNAEALAAGGIVALAIALGHRSGPTRRAGGGTKRTSAYPAERRVGGGPAAGIPAAVARRLDVDVDGRRQATIQQAQRSAQSAAEEHGRVRLGVRDRVSGASLDCNVVTPQPRRARGGGVVHGHYRPAQPYGGRTPTSTCEVCGRRLARLNQSAQYVDSLNNVARAKPHWHEHRPASAPSRSRADQHRVGNSRGYAG